MRATRGRSALTRLGVVALAATTSFTYPATAVAGTIQADSPVPTSIDMVTGPLQNSKKSTFVSILNGYWSEEGKTPGQVTYPGPGGHGVVSLDGTCVPLSQSPTSSTIQGVPVGDESNCLQFRSVVTAEGYFTFVVDSAGAATNGRYLGNGDGSILDLLSTKPITLFSIPEKPSATTGLAVEMNDSDGDGFIAAGDSVRWIATVANTGNVRLRDLDLKLSAGSTIRCDPDMVDAGAEITCTSDPLVLDQAAIDAGRLDASFSGVAKTPRGSAFNLPLAATVQPISARAVGGTSTSVTGGAEKAGEAVRVTTTLRNDGNVTLSDLVASVNGAERGCAADELAPGATTDCTFEHVVTQDEFDAGRLDFASTATGSAPSGAQVTLAASQAGVDFDRQGAISASLTPVSKDAPGVGDSIGLRLTVTNDGNASVRDLSVELQEQGVSAVCPASSLAPGASVDCDVTGEHTVTQQDVDAGSVSFAAVVTGVDTAGNAVQSEPSASQQTVAQAPTVDVTATPTLQSGGNAPKAGDEVGLTIRVENTGNVTLSDVAATVADRPGLAVACPAEPVAPGGEVECAVSAYVLTQADVDHGVVDFAVDVTAKGPKGQDATGSDAASVTIDQQYGVVAVAHAVLAGVGDVPRAGDRVSLDMVVRNSGNVTLRNLVAEVDGRELTVDCPDDALAPGAEATCTIADHELTQAELDAGSADFAVSVEANGPGGRTASATDSARVELARVPSITTSATSVLDPNEHEVPRAGDTATIAMTVRNTGNVTVSGVRGAIVDRDDLDVDCTSDSLAPGATTDCVVSEYSLTQEDVDAGGVRFDVEAAATGTNRVRAEAEASTTLSVVRAPAITSTATASLLGTDRVPAAGDEAALTVRVHNAGNVTVHGISSVVEGRDGMDVSCDEDVLAPGADATCRAARYRMTQGGIDAGRVDFTVASAAVGADGRPVTASAEAGVTVERTPAVDATVVAHLAAAAPQAPKAGDRISVGVRVTNTGNVTLASATSEIVEMADMPVACAPGAITPGATVECTAPEYVLTQDDIERGQVTVAAVVDAHGPGSMTASDRDDVRVGLDAASALDLTAEPVVADSDGNLVVLDADRALRPGDEVRVRYTVVNTGNLSVEGVQPRAGTLALDVEDAALQPGERTTATSAPHTVTEAEAQSGEVVLVGQVQGKIARADGDSAVQSGTTTGQAAAPAVDHGEHAATTIAVMSAAAAPSVVADEQASVVSAEVRTVVRAEPAPAELAFTGSDVVRVALPGGVVLLLGGALLLVWAQRRRRSVIESDRLDD